ncbi:Lrp/AsnC family transcriptional regulator [Halovibrio sp. HP20-50]|uniref:Lrp/AsnC family transcriptional regulator n=1 Tax=Halovibrio sp. HP20-59 TaxID=3080275 RepID=UPI00294AFF9C|nr:Lrp/AsnC family transcriptional regulator [Halovibrio sp. HP20-59]MEA2118530.1 Lrp/AsnC family transcriptional regulator [Halovibrio sp. HP20-59]
MHCHYHDLDSLDRRLIDCYQRDLPVCSRPFLAMAEHLNTTEEQVIKRLQRLQAMSVLSRVGPVFDHALAGASLLATVAVPDNQRDAFAELINQVPGVNHNYAREHYYNLWFVMTAADESSLAARLNQLETMLDRKILRLPMLESFHIDLAFKIPWSELEEV